MKVYFRSDHLLIVSDQLVSILSFLTGFGKKAMAFTIFMCIIVRNLDHPMTNQWINHERIHIRQLIESLGLFFVIAQFEYLYARIILKYNHMEAYKYECIEQEAYLNQSNSNYLKERPLFRTYRNIRGKVDFRISEDYQVTQKSDQS